SGRTDSAVLARLDAIAGQSAAMPELARYLREPDLRSYGALAARYPGIDREMRQIEIYANASDARNAYGRVIGYYRPGGNIYRAIDDFWKSLEIFSTAGVNSPILT